MRISRRRRRKLFLAATGIAASAMLFVAVWYGGDALQSGDATGTMSGAAGLSVGTPVAGWQIGDLDRDRMGALNDVFTFGFDVRNNAGEEREIIYSLYFSRDGEFSATDDCRIRTETVRLAAGDRASVSLRSQAQLIDCLDAGPWHAAVLDEATGEWTVIDTPYEIRGGTAEMKLATAPGEVGHRATVPLQIEVARPSGAIGSEGLWQHPLDIWLRNDEATCLIEADAVDLPRDPIRRGEVWLTQHVAIEADLRKAVSVTSMDGYPDPFIAGTTLVERATCEGCRAPVVAGRCNVAEGEWAISVGPAAAEWHTVGSMYVHAAPATIDPSAVELTLSEGGVGSVERLAYNPGRSSIGWTVSSADDFTQGWLVGMKNQQLPGRKPTSVPFTISAADLAPGVYSGTFVFKAADFYGTEVRIPVELTVLASRQGADDPSESQTEAVSNYPNPFSGRTTIQVTIQREGRYRVSVYDVQGREVGLLLDEWLGAGQREIPFDAQRLPSGTYLYRLTGEGVALSGTMSLVR